MSLNCRVKRQDFQNFSTLSVYKCLFIALGLADNSCCPEKLKVQRLTTGCKNIDIFLRGNYEMHNLWSEIRYWMNRTCLISALTMYHWWCFAGGVLNRGITEVAGESASGKTQLCMQLCITVQLPREMHGLDSGKSRTDLCVLSLSVYFIWIPVTG